MPRDPKPFLDYLDKEMTIMGILSAFCIAVLVLVIDKIAGASNSTELAALWKVQSSRWLLGAGALLVAALFFYRQRSYLAWYYGQIALAQVEEDKAVEGWLRDADSWETWLYYRDAFACLSFGFFQFAVAVVQQHLKVDYPPVLSFWLPLVGCIGAALLQRHVLTKYRFHDEPWSDWRRGMAPSK